MTSIKAEKRDLVGKKAKNLRKAGKIPAIVYGAGESGLLLEISGHDFQKVFRQAGESSLVELEIGPERKNVLIHDVAYDPIKDVPVHVDFLQVRMDKLIKAKLEIEALPVDLPHQIKIDLSKLKNFEDKFTVSDLDFPKGVKTHAAGEEVLALIKSPRTEEELKAEEVAAAPGIESIEVLTKKEKPIEEGEAKDGAAKEKE